MRIAQRPVATGQSGVSTKHRPTCVSQRPASPFQSPVHFDGAAPGMTARAARLPTVRSESFRARVLPRYIGTAKRPLKKVGIDIPTISKEKNGKKVNRQFWLRHEFARASDRLT